MNSIEIERLVWLSQSRDVAVLRWPEDTERALALDDDAVPRLFLVEPGGTPPVSGSCLEDWLMLPATELEIQTRIVNLTKRAAHHPGPPTLDEFGQLAYRGRSVFLSPTDQRLVGMLVERFGAVVAERELIDRVWPAGATNQVLRVHVSRLRQRLLPVELTIKSVRGAGYLLVDAAAADARSIDHHHNHRPFAVSSGAEAS